VSDVSRMIVSLHNKRWKRGRSIEKMTEDEKEEEEEDEKEEGAREK